MYTVVVELMWSSRRSQHRDHGANLRSEHCGAVNSIAETPRQLTVLAQSKFPFKGFFKNLVRLRPPADISQVALKASTLRHGKIFHASLSELGVRLDAADSARRSCPAYPWKSS